jgi:uncharacterized protein (DUF1697 family)
MPRYIALLRAINVGGHTVKMDRLRALFEELGFAEVETFIASGNVIFRSPETDVSALEARIEAHLQAALGYPVATFLRTAAELAAVVRHRPFAAALMEEEGNVLYAEFLRAEPDPEHRQKLLSLATPTDDFHLHGRELYWLRHGRMSDSKLTPTRLEKAAGMPMTARNISTVRNLAEKWRE